MRRDRLWWAAVAAMVLSAAAAQEKGARTVIEVSKVLPRESGMSTTGYSCTDVERPFNAKINEEGIDLWAGNEMPPATNEGARGAGRGAEKREKTTEELVAQAKAYTLTAQAGRYVGWCGVVRAVKWDEALGRSELLVQHCYNDGMTDTDIEVVSVYGAGDFRATIAGKADAAAPLSLVRVYGTVSVDKDGLPTVAADYVRVWNWGQFTFMDYGFDKTNPKWKALRKVEGPEVYTHRPDAAWYESVLGRREAPTTRAGK